MLAHLRACLWLLVLTVVLCCVVYPLALLAVGQALFPSQANGSLVYDDAGKPIGSTLIAQEFTGDAYFQARPSAVGYNGAASGATNYGASNPLLRDRIAKAAAPLARYGDGPRKGQPVASDVVAWFRQQRPDLAAAWAKDHATLAQDWIKADAALKDYVMGWFKERPAALAAWKQANPKTPEPAAEDLAVAFFESLAQTHPATWLKVVEVKDQKTESGDPVKRVELIPPTAEDTGDLAAVFFDAWRQEHPDVVLDAVPADLVMRSASGLDPHITLTAALYQLDRVAAARAAQEKRDVVQVRTEIERLLRRHASAPLFGLAGEPLVNVLEVNWLLKQRQP